MSAQCSSLWFRCAVTLLGMLLGVTAGKGQEGPPRISAPEVREQNQGLNRASGAVSPAAGFSTPGANSFRESGRAVQEAGSFAKPLQLARPGTIEKMEAAFYCNDTPFIDQVRLPVAVLWHGRVRFTGFESDVTTANFVLGLPGAGTLQSLSLMGSGHLATNAPPSDQLVGMHVSFNISGGDTKEMDKSGLRGMEYLVRSGRNFLQTFQMR